MVTPITTDEPWGVTVLGRTVTGAGSPRLVVAAGAGISASTSWAGLSSRKPLNAAWRSSPSP